MISSTPAHPAHRWNATSVGTRMTLLLALTVAAVTIGFLLVQRSLSDQLDVLVREHVSETARVLQRVLALRASGASVHADDYTRWDDFVSFTRKPDSHWGEINLTESIATFGLDGAWVLDDHYRLIYTANPTGDPTLAVPPVPLERLAAALAESPIRHFYTTTGNRVLEVWTSSIQPSSDFNRKVPASGFYVVGRLWTKARISELSSLVDGSVTLSLDRGATTGATGSSETGEIRIALPFDDVGGARVAVLTYATTYPAAPRVRSAIRMFLMLMMGGALLLFVCVSVALTRWVGRPLALITASLRTENPSLLDRSMARDDELGDLARLVRDFFAQRGHLVKAREATEAAALAKQQFLANISHELRTPMYGIISFSRFGIEDAPGGTREELLDYFQQISTCGATLLYLLDDLLDLAKFDSGRMRLEFGATSIDEVAREAAQEFTSFYRERKVTLDFQADPGLAPVRADRNRLRQIFRNILSNAGKFTPVGSTVVLRVAKAGDHVRVTVEDSGRGIPENELESVFDRFSQASNNRGGSGGTGLGLPLCRELVKAHGGRIWAENRESGGTRMIVEIPCSGPPAHLEGSRGTPEDSEGGQAAA
jgi:signal transduction histidine kinase